MNIQQYYQKNAAISLNASLISLIIPFFLVIYGIIVQVNGKLVIIILPFLFYSFICFQAYLLNDTRAKEILEVDDKKMPSTLLTGDAVLITFLPAPSLRMLFFSANGCLLGELKDIKFRTIRWFMPYFLDKLFARNYGLYNESNQIIAFIRLKNNRIEILDNNKTLRSTIFLTHIKKEAGFFFQSEGKQIFVERSLLSMDCRFFKEDGIALARVRKGLMPVEWGKRFRDPNTPVLTFEQGIKDEDKVAVFAILSKILRYSNH